MNFKRFIVQSKRLFMDITTNQQQTVFQHTINKGFGAGGANTNKNGLPYEELTDLHNNYQIIASNNEYNIIKFKNNENEYMATKQYGLFKCMKDELDTSICKAHGCKNPDECFIDKNRKTIFIIEKKFQQVGGSVCEKIQTPDFKVWQYRRTFPLYQIVYIYCLSEWFKDNCKAELEYLQHKKIAVFFGNDTEYKTKIIDYIVNYTR